MPPATEPTPAARRQPLAAQADHAAQRLPPLHGIVPSMNTAFLDDGSLDLQGIRRCADATIVAGVAGMLILAVAGETASLDAAEKRQVAQAFLQQAAGRVPVIMGCSSAHQRERLELAAMARQLGADTMLCQVPDGLRGAALLAQLRELAEVGPPVLMLQDLDFSGPGLPLEDIVLLHRHLPALRWLKIEVAQSGPKYSAVLSATQGRLQVSGGWAAAQMMEALHRGVQAFMPTAMDRLYVEIFRRFRRGDHAGARALHADLAPVLAFSNQHIGVSSRFFKALRQREGIFTTAHCRAGVAELDPHQRREMEANIERVLLLQAQLTRPG